MKCIGLAALIALAAGAQAVAQVPPFPPGPPGLGPPVRLAVQPAPEQYTGRVARIDGDQLTLELARTREKLTRLIAPGARIVLNSRPARLQDLEMGDFVRITVSPDEPDLAIEAVAARQVIDTPPRVMRPDPWVVERPEFDHDDPEVLRHREMERRTDSGAVSPGAAPHAAPGSGVGMAPGAGVVADRQREPAGLGVVLEPGDPDDGGQAPRVAHVLPNSPAEFVGIEPGDMIVAFDRQRVSSPDQFVRHVRAQRPGQTVTLHVHRDGETFEVSVALTTQSSAPDQVRFEGEPPFEPENGRNGLDEPGAGDEPVFEEFQNGQPQNQNQNQNQRAGGHRAGNSQFRNDTGAGRVEHLEQRLSHIEQMLQHLAGELQAHRQAIEQNGTQQRQPDQRFDQQVEPAQPVQPAQPARQQPGQPQRPPGQPTQP